MQIQRKYHADYQEACKLFLEERERFLEELQSINFLRVIPSQANYFLCEITEKYTSAELVELLLKQANLLVKDCSGKIGFEGKNYIRVAVRTTEDNRTLIQTLKNL